MFEVEKYQYIDGIIYIYIYGETFGLNNIY